MYAVEHRWTLHGAGRQLQQPSFSRLVWKFLYTQLYPDSAVSPNDILEDSLPMIDDNIHVFNSAIAIFHAPSNISAGITGMHHEQLVHGEMALHATIVFLSTLIQASTWTA